MRAKGNFLEAVRGKLSIISLQKLIRTVGDTGRAEAYHHCQCCLRHYAIIFGTAPRTIRRDTNE